MKYIIGFLILLYASSFTSAQKLDDSLAFYADVMINAEYPSHRLYAHQLFDRIIRDKLSSDDNFNRSFELAGIPLLYGPDSSFRILTWQTQLEDRAITKSYLQYKGDDELIEFTDRLANSVAQEYGILPADRWIGAVYTSIHSVPGHDSLYLLKGFNHLDPYSTLQVMEILDLRSGNVQLGAPLFENDENEIVHRRLYEVASGSNFNLVISDSTERIVSDHLVAVPYNRNESRMVNVPDGSYEVLEWNGQRWVYKDRLFENRFQELPLDSVPVKKETRDIFGRPKGKN